MKSSAQLTKLGFISTYDDRQIERLQSEFEDRKFILLPKLIEATLLERLELVLNSSTFTDRYHSDVGQELCLDSGPAVNLLRFLANNTELFRFISRVTKCGPIGCFSGRIYRMLPSHGHFDDWHDDQIKDRIAGMTINLGKQIYEDGLLEIRNKQSKRQMARVTNTGLGDAILFCIDDTLEHRRTEVTGSVSRTAFAGWFKSKPSYLEVLKSISAEASS